MKWMWCVAVVFAASCKKDGGSPSGSVTGSGSGAAVASDAGLAAVTTDAAPQLVELLRGVPATVRVSSQVKNPKIKPEHIVDSNPSTAWNSVTGELVGAWIDVSFTPGTHIAEVRMTIGHTGKSADGKDYFTMNPRITKVKVVRAGKPETIVALDAEQRALQAIAIDAATSARIVVAEITPGSKKSWREIAVSELEVWGTPPAGWTKPTAPLTPRVEVGEAAVVAAAADPDEPCPGLQELKAEREAKRRADEAMCNKLPTQEQRDQCNVDAPGDPDCTDVAVTIDKLAPPWKGASVSCQLYDDIYGPNDCSLTIATKDDSVVAASVEIDGKDEIDVVEAGVADVIAGAPSELVARYKEGAHSSTDYVVVCRAKPLACAEPIMVTADDWEANIAFKRGAAVLTTKSGKPPATAIGTKPLVFK